MTTTSRECPIVTSLPMLLDPSIRLREAVTAGNLLIVKRLLRRFPDYLTNIDPTNGWTSLHYAAYHGWYLICVYLIQLGHDKREMMRTFKGNNCVHLAMMNGHEQTTHLLLQHFPQHIDRPGQHGRTPVHIACLHNYYQCLSLLMGVGAKLKLPDDDGETPLHICLEYGSINCMKMLIFNGGVADDNVKNNYHWRPSDVAETFELGKQYAKLLKESENSGVRTRSSYSSFKTPVLSTKPVFDDGPSPVLTMNSPYSLPSHNGGHTQLSKVPTSRPSGIGIVSKSQTGNQSYQSRLTSKNSFLTNSSSSIDRKDGSHVLTNPNSNSNSNATSNANSRVNLLDRKLTGSSPDVSPTKKGEHDANRSRKTSNVEYINKYLSSTGNSAGSSTGITQTGNDEKNETNPAELLKNRRKVSLLNIPVEKLRHNDDE